MIGAVVLGWKNAIDESKSLRERRFMKRIAEYQTTFFVLTMFATLYGLPKLQGHPLGMAIGLAALTLVNLAVFLVSSDQMNRRRTDIIMEEGTWANEDWSGPGEEDNQKARRKALKAMLPILMIFALGTIGLPWREHLGRSAIAVVLGGVIILWGFRRFQKLLSFGGCSNLLFSKAPAKSANPVILVPAIILGRPDRMMLVWFSKKLAQTKTPLSAGQEQQLLDAMAHARAQYNWSTDLGRRNMSAGPVRLFSPANIEVFAREEEDFDRQFISRSAAILAPDQLASFQEFQAKQRKPKVATMKMTAKMLAPTGASQQS
jgi:hypothetical protein